MAKALELQIEDSSATGGYLFFAVEGEFTPSFTPVYNRGNSGSSNAPFITEIRETWEFTECKMPASDGTTATLWATDMAALRSALFERDAHPAWVRLVENPRESGVNVLFTLGPSTYEDLQFELIEGAQDKDVPAASWKTTATFNFTVSARLALEDANGIVGFDQSVRVEYKNGLRNLRWRTTITTKEGTSAVTKAQTYARIPVAALGGDHAYQTNGPDGIEYEYTDADEENNRTPTICIAASEIQQFGEQIGATSSSGSPNFYVYSVETRKEKNVEETVYSARAEGPNALSYVRSKKPGGKLVGEVEVVTPTANIAEGTWVKRKSQPGQEQREEFKITLTPGVQPVLLRPTTGGFAPHESTLGFTHWQCTVQVAVFKVGSEDIDFPGLLPAPWKPFKSKIEEDQAILVGDISRDPSTQEYVRRAKIPYYALSTPRLGGKPVTSFLLAQLRDAERVNSYVLEG